VRRTSSAESGKGQAMIFGFNTDVPANGKTYHVQTEDRGEKNPVVDSIIYLGGKIVDRVRTPYDFARSTQVQIEALVRTQHRELVESIRSGTFTPHAAAAESDGPTPGGYGIRMLNPGDLERDGQLCFEIAVWNRKDPGPGSGVALDVRWMTGNREAQRSQLETERDGRALISFPLPAQAERATLLISAKGAEGREVVKFIVQQGTAPAPRA
jgi:hypothetical protein